MVNPKIEILQEPPFASIQEEGLLNLLRTSDCLRRAFDLKVRDWGVTFTQYNILRILRAAQPRGLTCSAIGSRMIAAQPDITRLLARLKAIKLIRQRRDTHDRRVLWTQIAEPGVELLRQMDPVIERLPGELLGHLNSAELAELVRLLQMARKPIEPAQAPLECK